MSKLLINENPLMVLPTLALKVGLNEAILLQQVHYWLDPRINKNYLDNKFWVYNTLEKWQKQFPFWSRSTLRRTIKNLETSGLLLSKSRVLKGFDHTKWYSIDYDKLDALNLDCGSYAQNEHADHTKMNISNNQNEHNDKFILNSLSDQSEQQHMFKMNKTYKIDTENTSKKTTENQRDLKRFLSQYERIFNPDGNNKEITLDDRRVKNFSMILKEFFDFDYEKWSKFLERITTSKFLMGEINTFRIHFDWLIKKENIIKVLEGAYFSSESLPRKDEVVDQFNNKVHQYLDTLNGKEKGLYKQLLQNMGYGQFGSWFIKTKPILDIDKMHLNIFCDSKFVLNWIKTNFDIQISKATKELGLGNIKTHYLFEGQ